jgi:hypothetical protein
MTFEELNEWTIMLGAKTKLSSDVRQRVSRELPSFVRDIDPKTAPKRYKLPTGESLGDATRMTAIKCHCLLLARKVHGSGFVKIESSYEALARDLLFRVMRHNFNTGGPKGVFCCPPCTISLLPLYALGCFRWVNCDELKSAVVDAMVRRQSVFNSDYPRGLRSMGSGICRRLTRRVAAYGVRGSQD